jgi:hypothetical protein
METETETETGIKTETETGIDQRIESICQTGISRWMILRVGAVMEIEQMNIDYD